LVVVVVVVLIMEFSELDGQTIWKRKQNHQDKHQYFYLLQNKPQQVERQQVN
jgi:hypothetical protein